MLQTTRLLGSAVLAISSEKPSFNPMGDENHNSQQLILFLRWLAAVGERIANCSTYFRLATKSHVWSKAIEVQPLIVPGPLIGRGSYRSGGLGQ